VLSLTCALLGGNSSIVRVPGAAVAATQMIIEKLQQVDPGGELLQRVALTFFDHDSTEMHEAMALSLIHICPILSSATSKLQPQIVR